MRIGRLAERGGVRIPTIRYYERRGLLSRPRRSSSGYRIYDSEAVKRLNFIKKAQQLGFSLNEIEELLSLRMRPGTTCADIREKARCKIVTVDRKIAELARIRGALAKLAAACRGKGPTSDCVILKALDTDRD